MVVYIHQVINRNHHKANRKLCQLFNERIRDRNPVMDQIEINYRRSRFQKSPRQAQIHIYTHPSLQPTPSILYCKMIGHTCVTSGYEFAFFLCQKFSKEGITACNKIPLLNLYQNQNIQLLESVKGNLAMFPKRTRNVVRSLIVADLNLRSFCVTDLFPNHIPSLQGPTPQSAWLHYVHRRTQTRVSISLETQYFGPNYFPTY